MAGYPGWENLAILAALISVFASALLLMFGRVFEARHLVQTAKTELLYAISTVLLVIFIIGAVDGAQVVLGQAASTMFGASFGIPFSGRLVSSGGDPLTLIDITKLYLEPAVTCSTTLIKILYGISIVVEPLASVYMEVFMSEHASGLGFKLISERLNTTTNFLQFFVFAFYFLVHTLNFLDFYAPFFITIGVVLRAFPPTRGAGAFVIAFSIGMYIIFPMAYITGASLAMPYVKPAYMVIDPNNPIHAAQCASNPNLPQCIDNPADAIRRGQVQATSDSALGIRSFSACLLPNFKDVNYCGFGSVGKAYELKTWFDLNKPEIDNLLTVHVFDLLTHLTIVICFLPLVAMVLVLTFVLSTTNLFGGNIPEIGRGLIKFL